MYIIAYKIVLEGKHTVYPILVILYLFLDPYANIRLRFTNVVGIEFFILLNDVGPENRNTTI